MGAITLKQIHEDLVKLMKDVESIKEMVGEEYGLSDDVIKDMEDSRKRPEKELISHEEMKKEFG